MEVMFIKFQKEEAGEIRKHEKATIKLYMRGISNTGCQLLPPRLNRNNNLSPVKAYTVYLLLARRVHHDEYEH